MSTESKTAAQRVVLRLEDAYRAIVNAHRQAQDIPDPKLEARIKAVLSEIANIKSDVNTKLGHITG